MTVTNYFGLDEYEGEESTTHTLIDLSGGTYGWFGECSCGWGTGPVESEQWVLEDFVLHRRHKRGDD